MWLRRQVGFFAIRGMRPHRAGKFWRQLSDKLKGERGEALRCLLYLFERDEAAPLIGAG